MGGKWGRRGREDLHIFLCSRKSDLRRGGKEDEDVSSPAQATQTTPLSDGGLRRGGVKPNDCGATRRRRGGWRRRRRVGRKVRS